MGAAISSIALLLGLILRSSVGADVVLVALLLAAGLESFAGYCLGCKVFGRLMRLGIVPAAVCRECADMSLRRAPASAR